MFKKRTVLGSTAASQQRLKKRPLDQHDKDSSSEGNSSSSDSDSETEIPSLSKPVFKRRMVKSTNSDDKEESGAPQEPISQSDKSEDKNKDKGLDQGITADTHSERLIREDRERRRQDMARSKTQEVQQKDSEGNRLYTGKLNNVKDQSTLKLKGQSTNIKTTTVMDFQADVCKDFLKNGYCGYGDTCKFLHYRDEFKVVKNQKPREWEEVLKKRGKKW